MLGIDWQGPRENEGAQLEGDSVIWGRDNGGRTKVALAELMRNGQILDMLVLADESDEGLGIARCRAWATERWSCHKLHKFRGIESSVVDMLCLRCLSDIQMEMSSAWMDTQICSSRKFKLEGYIWTSSVHERFLETCNTWMSLVASYRLWVFNAK